MRRSRGEANPDGEPDPAARREPDTRYLANPVQNILQYIPCYCGCGANGHKNNYDCFVASRAANGWKMRTAVDARWPATGPSTPTPLP